LVLSLDEAEKYIFYYINLSHTQAVFSNEVDFSNEQYINLLKNGYCEFSIPPSERFLTLCQNQLVEAREKYKDQDNLRRANWEGFNKTELYALIKKIILDNQILELIVAYKG
jgi:hypothetical protein